MCDVMCGRALIAGAMLLSAGSAHGAIVSVSGQVTEISPPASVVPGALESAAGAIAFLDAQLVLTADVSLDASGSGTYNSTPLLNGGTISLGTPVDSYIVHADLPGTTGAITHAGSITFDQPILGVQVLTASIDASDAQSTSGTTLPTGVFGRGLELENNPDFVQISADGLTLSFSFFHGEAIDQIRVFTASDIPTPGTIVIGAVGGLAIARRRRG